MKKALTIPEILIATMLLAVVLGGILMLFISCMLLNEANRNSTIAITHAQYILEEVRGTEFDYIADDISQGVWDLDATALEADPYNLSALTNETVDTSVATVGNLLEVTVDVAWKDRRGRDRSEQLVTRIADYQ